MNDFYDACIDVNLWGDPHTFETKSIKILDFNNGTNDGTQGNHNILGTDHQKSF